MDCDDILIKSAQEGDKEAFNIIIKKYYPLIVSICQNISGCHEEALNLAQESFIKVYNSLKSFEGKSFKSWIARIATNTAIDWKRKNRLSKLFSIVLDEIDIADKENYQTENILIRKENTNKVNEMLQSLPEIYRIVLTKYYFETKSYQTIASEECISTKTVESRLYRAKQIIREKWEGEFNETY